MVRMRSSAPALAFLALIATGLPVSAQTVTFTRTSFNAPAAVAASKVIALRDGRMLLLSATKLQIFDPIADAIAASADTTIFASGAAATLLADGRVLITGGASLNNGSRLVTTGASTIGLASTGNMLGSRSGHALVTMPDGRVLAYGGAGGPSEI